MQVAIVLAAAFQFVVFVQITLPITPPSHVHGAGLDARNQLFADSVGWDDIARQVQRTYAALPEEERRTTIIISAYYGVPGALRVYGNPQRLPQVVSPQLSDWYWLPDHLTAVNALMVDYRPPDVVWMCDSPRLIAHLTVPYQVRGLEQGAPVTFCHLKAPVQQFWGRLRNFS
jgi:hypothetical protein